MTKSNRRLNVLSLANRPQHARPGCEIREMASAGQKHFDIQDDVLRTLRDDVMLRRVERGMEWLGNQRSVLLAINPEHRNTAPFIGYLAQWVGISDLAGEAVRELLGLFPQPARSRLTLIGYIYLRLADGILELAEGKPEAAAAHFELVLSFEREAILEREQLALGHFWMGVCERRRGNWDSALEHAARARSLSLSMGYAPAAAMMQAFEGCLNVRKGKLSQALELLREAEAVLQQTDDLLWLGNIRSGYGTAALEEGQYELALESFTKAVCCYQERNPRHRNLARSLASLAHSQRLIANRIARTIDSHAEKRRRAGASDTADMAGGDGVSRERMEQLRGAAFVNSARAIEIYRALGECRGLALARIERGFLSLDCGDFDRAALEAKETFELGSQKKDYSVMAYARLLHSKMESAQYEEGIGDAPALHAQRANDFAKDALTCATQTGDRQLIARVYLCQGLIFCNEFFNNAEAADECCRQARECLPAGHRNQLWEEYEALASKVLRTTSVDSKLRQWSQGLAENKTFQQMTEEFAELVIPSVWEKEGRNVSRVVTKLSISPKKVRRILNRVGVKPVND